MKICLIGSGKFWDEFERMERIFSLRGHCVYSLGNKQHNYEGDVPKEHQEDKFILDGVHMAKIAASDLVYVINRKGYIGESTKRELYAAIAMGKYIQFSYWNSFVTDVLERLNVDILRVKTSDIHE